MTTLEGQGVLMGDGTLVSTARYAQVDFGWSLAVLDYFLVESGGIYAVPFTATHQPIQISGQPTLKIALFSDWGSGAYSDCGWNACLA